MSTDFYSFSQNVDFDLFVFLHVLVFGLALPKESSSLAKRLINYLFLSEENILSTSFVRSVSDNQVYSFLLHKLFKGTSQALKLKLMKDAEITVEEKDWEFGY